MTIGMMYTCHSVGIVVASSDILIKQASKRMPPHKNTHATHFLSPIKKILSWVILVLRVGTCRRLCFSLLSNSFPVKTAIIKSTIRRRFSRKLIVPSCFSSGVVLSPHHDRTANWVVLLTLLKLVPVASGSLGFLSGRNQYANLRKASLIFVSCLREAEQTIMSFLLFIINLFWFISFI